ncbi:MAG: histidinol dehydrogenase [Acidiferrobacterales bacterium]
MAALNLRMLDTRARDFERSFLQLQARGQMGDANVDHAVREILEDVRVRGDKAVLEHTRRYDRYQAESLAELEVSRTQLDKALTSLPSILRSALEQAARRIRTYHERQRVDSWQYHDDQGTLLGQQVTALDKVGMYVPGGRAAYPSSVLMNAIPARVAGVAEVIMAAPAPDGETNEIVLAAARLVGVNRVFAIGGAQAIAALAYGTATVPRVDKIVGPGNAYVASAKRMVFGQVDIDMIAGPSEVVVVCDGGTDPAWIAMDLFAQAEHDEDAQAILISLDASFTDRVRSSIDQLLGDMERRDIIKVALERQGALITVRSVDEAVDLVNQLAPEHLELSLEDPLPVAQRVRHAGAIFLGRYSAEVLGDYCAGPNHVLPTAGTARFSSPLGVYDFQKRTNLVMCTPQGAAELARTASVLAQGEGLAAHARSAQYRINEGDK